MKLSIVTINYNNAEGLRKTLASVASQTYASIQHVIVDGSSSDASKDIIIDYAEHTKNPNHEIIWVSEKDKGIYNAMNKGIRMATGEYIEILNSGDILAADDVTERMMAALEEKAKQQQNTNNHSVMEQHTITANENNASSPHRLIASSPITNIKQ